jgi:PKD repeat protein
MRRISVFVMVFCLAGLGLTGAAEIDLGTSMTGPTTATEGEQVVYTVEYSNNSADLPGAAISWFYTPQGAFLNEEDAFYDLLVGSFTDSRTNTILDETVYLRSSCDQLQFGVYNADNETIDVPANGSGQYSTTVQMPMTAPKVAKFIINEPADLAGEYLFNQGECDSCDDPGGATCMGTPPGLIDPPISGNLVLAEPADGCTPLTNAAEIEGNIALIDRGVCYFGEKALYSHSAGAIATIIVNDRAADAPNNSIPVVPGGGAIGVDQDGLGLVATGPVLYITQEDGDPIKAAAAGDGASASIGLAEADELTFAATIFHYTGSPDTDPDGTNDDSAVITALDFGSGPDAPEAAFTFEATNLMVAFTDTSTNSPTSWAWDFGDGGTSEEQNPTYTYAATGTYTVGLTATNAGGADTFTTDVTVTDAGPELDMFYFVPAAAKAEGEPGTFFITDLAINNTGTMMANYQFLWLPRGQDNSTPAASEPFTLGAGMTATYSDVLGEVFDAEDGALGAFAVISDSSDLILMSRTFNQGADGTFGQAIPGYAMAQLIPENMRMRIIFMLQNDNYRSNLGLMNGTGAPMTVNWEIFASDGTSLGTGSRDLAPWSNTQVNRVLNAFAPIEGAYIDVWTTTSGGAFAAYGSVLDNMTDDPTTVLPQ